MLSRRSAAFARVVALLVAILASATASAQVRSDTPASAGAAVAPASGDKQAEARARFNRALELYDDGDSDAALLELERAYDLAPSFRILYNIGLIYQQLKDYARALDAFEGYLRGGGAEVPADRVVEIQRRIERLRDRVAYVAVETAPPGAEIAVDDVVVAHSPLPAPIRVNSGERRISARLAGQPGQTRVIGLAGGERASVTFDFEVAMTPPPPPPTPSHIVSYVAWGTTGAIAAAAVTTGILALAATSSYDAEVSKFGISGSDVSAAWDKAHGFAVATDVLLGVAVVAAGVSTYLTFRGHKEPARGALIIGPGVVAGRF